MRDWSILLLFGILINNIAGAAWGASTLSLLGPMNTAGIFLSWLIGNILVTILILPLALRLCTERVRGSRLFVKKFWE